MARNTFDQDETLQEEFNWHHYQRLGKYIAPYKRPVTKALLVIIFANMLAMLGPYFTKLAIDRYLPNQDVKGLVLMSLLFLLSLIGIGWSMRYRIYHITEIGQNILKDMRYDIFSHLQTLPFSYFDNRPHGKILIRVVNYINTLSDLLSNGLINLISDVFSLVLTLGVMLWLDVKLTLYSLLLLPVLLIIVLLVKKAQRTAYQELSNKQSNMNAYIHESISGIKVTQSFTQEETSYQTFTSINEDYRKAYLKAVRVQFLLWPGVQNISVMTTALIYFIGIRSIGVDMTTGTLIAFIGYINNFWNPVINIGNFYNSLITATAYLERIFETLDVEPEIQDAPHAIEMPEIQGNVVFDDVVFSYEDNQPILNHVSLNVEAGQSVALVGPTGAGKTTIINLLSRFYDIDSGQILIDGIDIRDVTLKSLRQQMGVMLQDTFVFSGTILDNIQYGNPQASREEIIAAAKVVRAHDFIKELKDGYDTVVEERGSTLSAGQRQLISFARALLADPKILILDEATSSIDTKTEQLLQDGLQKLLHGRTSFIIAHRLSTIKNCDKIFYIDKGNIQESGTHDTLMAQKGRYHYLYQSQYDLLKV
ncbi:ABC transporter ATP-binding protein/permease [Vagococcus lutrae]|uniref:ABC transporter ATP-binding protein n=1 Tax=Vagococcus lutrae TaxID=81947 RepID=UPI000F86B269|nr:ABC transporter ATP-binding protein [Vagococcus lutrae]MDT2816779.1 ABC transporter ATP-binding protein [Vagococcus lutrae]MDT2825443.1 ABC transporter ATP-binding protein [Vagococcus lutrae]NKZ27687.1 ABC transporter ATP-binding protein [Vagococcus lutrae]QZN88714.1 ABC transporter ATP-binding protein/permease [Vagococcus lutrae]RST91288.1 multidrug ABC transporter ATP-binding protein [Vagococcus lutrae]